MYASCPAHPFLNFIILIISDEEYNYRTLQLMHLLRRMRTAAVHLPCSWEALGSNLSLGLNCADRCSWFLSGSTIPEQYIETDYDHFLLYPFQFTIHNHCDLV
jgi:hypothetical protein